MASNFATNFLPSPRSSSLPSNEGGDDMMDLDAIIAQLGQLESQLSCRESELQVATAANRIAEKSNQLDLELHNVLQELSNLESGEEYGGAASPTIYCPSEQFPPRSDGHPRLPGGYLAFDDDVVPSMHPSESKNSFGTISSQSSHSSSTSTGSAKIPQTLVRVYSPDGSCKTVAVDEQTTVARVCQVLAKKHLLTMPLNWAIVECLPALHMERILEDHLLIMDQINLWTKDSCNRLVFVERPEKYSIFNDKEVKEAAANNSFSPSVDGFLHFKLEGKKVWKKLYFVLRASGLYYNPKGKGKAASDLVCLQPLQGVDFYFGIDWRKNYKSPTDFGFALKLPMIQKEVPKFVRFFCTEDKKMLMDWVAAFRLVKHGRQLYDSFTQAQLWSNSLRHESSAAKSRNSEVVGTIARKGSLEAIPSSPQRAMSPVFEPEGSLTPVRKDSSDYGTLKKSVPNIPITTNLTRHLSMQQQNYVRTLPRQQQRSGLPGFREDDSPSLPSRDGNFMRFPSPDFGLDQPAGTNGDDFHDVTATLPKRTPNRLLLPSESMRCTSTPRKYDTLSTRPVLRSPVYDRSPNPRSPSSGSSSHGSLSPYHMPSPIKGFPKAAGSSDDLCESYGFLSSYSSDSPRHPFPDQELPLPPPPCLETRGCNMVTASNQHLPLPPPPSELLSVDFSGGPHAPPAAHSSHLLPGQQGTNGGNQRDFRRSSSSTPTSPPAPPARSAETRLSIRRGSKARTQHIIMDLDRVMSQKQEQGANGLGNLEVPLPPQPSFNDDYMEPIDPFDLPPPPAEILESLKHLRNRPLPPLPPGPPPIHRPVYSKVN